MSILLVDSYDSFTYNLKNLIQTAIPNCKIYTVHNDSLLLKSTPSSSSQSSKRSSIKDYSQYINEKFDCIIIGPGPGNPNTDPTIINGVISDLYCLRLFDDVPVLGICLGFQMLGMALGYEVAKLDNVKHGQIAKVFLSNGRGQSTMGEDPSITEKKSNENSPLTAYEQPGLFEHFPEDGFDSVRYHSLHVVLDKLKTDLKKEHSLVPLAYTHDSEKLNTSFYDTSSNDHTSGKQILMAGKHSHFPFYGVQYHPESICSQFGLQLVKNFWGIVTSWNEKHSRGSQVGEGELGAEYKDQEHEFQKYFVNSSMRLEEDLQPDSNLDQIGETHKAAQAAIPGNEEFEHFFKGHKKSYTRYDIKFKKLSLQGNKFDKTVTADAGRQHNRVVQIVDLLKQRDSNHEDYFILDSSSDPGKINASAQSNGNSACHSIIGCAVLGQSIEITWSLNDKDVVKLNKWKSQNQVLVSLGTSSSKYKSIWDFLQSFMSEKFIQRTADHALGKPNDASFDAPFIGGLIGYMSYESGQFIDTKMATENNSKRQKEAGCVSQPDIKMIFVEKSIIYNSDIDEVTLLSLEDDEDDRKRTSADWLAETFEYLKYKYYYSGFDMNKPKRSISELFLEEERGHVANLDENIRITKNNIKITKPDKMSYFEKFAKCQEYLKNGDSYELCFCCSTDIEFPEKSATSHIDPWDIYKVLSQRNPAPFSGFLQFDQDSVLISSSPERFLSWKNSRDSPRPSKVVQLRPIKGTVKKKPGLTKDQVVEILYSPKEMGENLMIVDLIRHDLYSHCEQGGAVSDVKVSKLMQIEEYETVFQLVSVIECTINETTKERGDAPRGSTGFNILSTSLPPGSMTGAPKKNSVQLLQSSIEATANRGVYSGVFGYWSLDDQADWSVIIRSMFSYRNEKESEEEEEKKEKKGAFTEWRIGAGGAITVLSDAEGEWQEMNTKLDSILQMFD